MKVNNFLSKGKYIMLPTKQSPKVYLNISDNNIKYNSFKLYNPFSLKARILKSLVLNVNLFTNRLNNYNSEKKGKFIKYLENIFNRSIDSSIYISTDKNKIILQLQNNDDIIVYCKVGINELGIKRLENEKHAIVLLKDNPYFKVPKIIGSGEWNSYYYLIFEPIEIKKVYLEKSELQKILKSLYKNLSHPLNRHPRIIKLYKFFKDRDCHKFIENMNKYLLNNNIPTKEVYEHGDFAPWNITKNNNNLYLFDFEHFEERGIENLDMLKYFFQIQYLLKKKKKKELVKYLKKLKIKNIEIFTIIFLLSEIKNKIEEKKDYRFYESLLNLWLKEIE